MVELARVGEKVLRGIPVSPGVCRGKVHVMTSPQESIPKRQIAETEIVDQVHRLEQALVQTRQQILDVQRRVSEGMGAKGASIFDAHLLVLEDRTLLDEVSRMIHDDKVNVEFAFQAVAAKYIAAMNAIKDEFLRERAADMRDVTARVLNNLLGRDQGINLRELTEPCIIISHDLTPSTTALLDKKIVLGFATDIGSKTSHTAIMARSLRI